MTKYTTREFVKKTLHPWLACVFFPFLFLILFSVSISFSFPAFPYASSAMHDHDAILVTVDPETDIVLPGKPGQQTAVGRNGTYLCLVQNPSLQV